MTTDGPTSLAAHGRPSAEVVDSLLANRHDDAPWRSGRIFGLVFPPDDEQLDELLATVAHEYLAENALSPTRFPSLARLEAQVCDMVASLLHGVPNAAGLTSGGTESVFVAVSVARDVARERGVARPNIVTGTTAHPAFAKACHLLDVDLVRVPVDSDKRVDLDAARAAVGPETALVVGSAPCYPFGVIDPIGELASIAAELGTLCHVDACLGGLFLPFLEELGQDVRPWDLRVPGVTSVSADLHKYGYTFKGASVIAFRDAKLAARRIWFDDGTWGGGLYGTPTPAGTRPAAPIAGAWAALNFLGREGYVAKTRAVLHARSALLDAIASIPELELSVQPDGPVLQFGSTQLDVGALADALQARRWWLNRQPGGLHVMLSPLHARVVAELVRDLRAAVDEVRAGRTSAPTPAVYSMPFRPT